jgi:hypothetical protein
VATRVFHVPRPTLLRIDPLGAAFVLALVLGIVARATYNHAMPLWFDETFTGTIATQPTGAKLIRWCLTELTGPAFYAPTWLWAQVFGAGDVALRAPSLLLSIAAPLVLARWGHPDRGVRLFWAGAALLWLPALPSANDARPYAQLFFLACLQAIAFRRLLLQPTTRTALSWTVATAILLLTHYTSVIPGLIQGLVFLAIHRRRAVATWPALAPFVPVAAWIGWHWSFLTSMTMAPGSSGASIGPAELLAVPGMIFGVQLVGVVVIGIVLVTFFWPGFRMRAGKLGETPDVALATCALLALAATLGLAAIHLGFAARYLTPTVPSLLFGLALWARRTLRVDPRPVYAAFAVLAASIMGLLAASIGSDEPDTRHAFSLEPASAWLSERGPTRVVFLWTDQIGDMGFDRAPGNIADIAGFSFRRRGQPVAVDLVRRVPGRDPSTLARMAAGTDPRTAILWIANDHEDPNPTEPRVAEQDPSWHCRDFGRGHVTVVACRR